MVGGRTWSLHKISSQFSGRKHSSLRYSSSEVSGGATLNTKGEAPPFALIPGIVAALALGEDEGEAEGERWEAEEADWTEREEGGRSCSVDP